MTHSTGNADAMGSPQASAGAAAVLRPPEKITKRAGKAEQADAARETAAGIP